MNTILLKKTAPIFLGVVAALTVACVPQNTKYHIDPYVSKNLTPPPIKYCITPIGHKRGSKPFIYGGTCACTPTPKLMRQYHRDGYLKKMSYQGLVAEYKKRGIVLEHDGGWKCNNICPSGPHLVFGGKCMVPPTIGSQNYENVITGIKPTL